MKIYRKVIINSKGETIYEDSYEYIGPVVQCQEWAAVDDMWENILARAAANESAQQGSSTWLDQWLKENPASGGSLQAPNELKVPPRSNAQPSLTRGMDLDFASKPPSKDLAPWQYAMMGVAHSSPAIAQLAMGRGGHQINAPSVGGGRAQLNTGGLAQLFAGPDKNKFRSMLAQILAGMGRG